MNFLKKVSTGELIPFFSASLSLDKSSAYWSFNASIPTAEYLDKLKPSDSLKNGYVEVEFKLGLTTWALIAEEPDYGDTDNNFSISGRSRSILLTETFCEPITKTWTNTTPLSIIDELCTKVGVSFDFDNLDSWFWHIDSYTATERYPIDIIKELISEKKGIIQTLPNGRILITHNLPCSPKKLADYPHSAYIATDKNLFKRGKRFSNNKNYNSIFVTKDTGTLTDNAPSISIEEVQDGADAILKVITNPFCNVELTHTSGNNVAVFYEGVKTATITDQLIVDDKKAKLSKPFSELISLDWQQNQLGELVIGGNGDIAAPIGFGLVFIKYKSQYHQYRIQRTQYIDSTGIKIQNIDSPINIGAMSASYGIDTGNKPAPPVVVKTLATQVDLVERAQQELWEQVYDMDEYSITAAYENFPILPVTVCQVKINKENLVFNSYVKSVSINIGSTIEQQITVQRPLLP